MPWRCWSRRANKSNAKSFFGGHIPTANVHVRVGIQYRHFFVEAAMIMTTLGTRARATYSALACRVIAISSTPAQRTISRTSAPPLCAAHPEDRLKAARSKARAALGLPAAGKGVAGPPSVAAPRGLSAVRVDSPAKVVQHVSAKPHPEDRLKAARRKMLESMGLTVDGDGHTEPRKIAPIAAVVDTDANASPPMSICAQNNHPDYRLKLARERMLAKVKGDAGVDTGVTAGVSVHSLKFAKTDLDMSPDRRLRLARTEQAAKPIQSFAPLRRKKKRPKTGALLSRLCPEQPPLLRNDGYSSGAVASIRLRSARHDAIERLLGSSSSAASLSSTTTTTTTTKEDTRSPTV